MELRKASGLYSMTQARAIDTILDRADALRQHYQDRRLEQRQNERDQWADLLRDTKALLPEWNNDDVNRLIHDLDHPRDAMETLAQVWQPDNTILVAPDWETIHRYIQAVPFTASDDYPKVNGDADAYEQRHPGQTRLRGYPHRPGRPYRIGNPLLRQRPRTGRLDYQQSGTVRTNLR